ncbi:MAG TPA: hypothetical protein VFF69_04755 [Phycisphaerales bacterium]|nr:hypothetical protein [Phycisphaerales bacterium]
MPAALRHLIMLLLVAAQAVLGSSRSGAMCLGGAGCTDPTGAAAFGATAALGAPGCSHSGSSGHGPAPVEPHSEHEDECPCIDVSAPVARATEWRPGEGLSRQAVASAIAPAALGFTGVEAPAARPSTRSAQRPPWPGSALRTTRLLI